MQKLIVLIILLVLNGCMLSHEGMGHGGDRMSGSSHQH
jgi:hypothetical protein